MRGAGVGVGMLRGREIPLAENKLVFRFLGFLASWFQSLLVSWFQSFLVSCKFHSYFL